MNPAGVDRPPQQSVTGDGVVDPQKLLAHTLGVGVGQGEADVVGQGAEVGGVVVEAFQLDQ